MAAKQEALDALRTAHERVKNLRAQLADAEQQRLHRVADARSTTPPATWTEIGDATDQDRANAHTAFAKKLTETRQVTVKPAGSPT